MTRSVPETLGEGRYRLGAPIGEGGMAGVYRAEDTQIRVQRAIKVLRYAFARKKKIRVRFEAEARAMARVEHPNIVQVYDVGLEDRTPYIVMELVDGDTMEQLVEQGPLPPLEAIDLMVQVCHGVEHAHAAGIIHRDIKPQNVLIDRRGVAKLTDFGIAQSAGDERLTKTGSTMGTMGFMSPEQRYDAKSADVRADVFSLGATLWRLVSDNEMTELFLADEHESLMKGVHPALRDLILTATSYQPDDRYPNVGTLRNALRRARRIIEDERTAATDSEVASHSAVASHYDDGLPDYVDRASLKGDAPRPLSFGEAFPTAPPVPDRVDPAEAAASAARALLARPAVVVGLASLFVALLGGGALAWATVHARGAAQMAEASRSQLLVAVENEARLLDDVVSAGLSATALQEELGKVRAAKEADRPEAALRYVSAAKEVVAPFSTGALVPAEVRVTTRVNRLQAAASAYRNDMAAWEDASDGPLGGLVVSLGLAPDPH